MEDIHVHAENRLYKVYGPGPATIMAQVYAHMRGLGTIWLLSIIPFVIVYINTFNVQYGLTVSFFVVLIELGKHLSFYEGPPRAFLVLEYYPSDESGYEARIPHIESENSVSECNEDEGEETTIETSCEGEGNVSDHPCEGEEESDEESEDQTTEVQPTEDQPEQDCTEETQCCSKDQEETSNLESPSESAEPTEKNEIQAEAQCDPVDSTKED